MPDYTDRIAAAMALIPVITPEDIATLVSDGCTICGTEFDSYAAAEKHTERCWECWDDDMSSIDEDDIDRLVGNGLSYREALVQLLTELFERESIEYEDFMSKAMWFTLEVENKAQLVDAMPEHRFMRLLDIDAESAITQAHLMLVRGGYRIKDCTILSCELATD
jgi:hypothetical protein